MGDVVDVVRRTRAAHVSSPDRVTNYSARISATDLGP